MQFWQTGKYSVSFFLVILSLAGGGNAPALADTVRLQLGYSDKESSPFLTGNGGTKPASPGIAIDMVETAVAACSVEPSFARYPGGRLLALMQENTIDAAVMLSFSPERLALGVYPMRQAAADPQFQIATLTYAFYVRSDRGIRWDGKTFTGLTQPIGANLGWSVADDLMKMGLPVETAVDTQNNFNKLLLGRIDAFAIHTTIGDAYIADRHIGDRIKELDPPISTKPYYLVFSHGWYAQHRDTAGCIWQSIEEQRKNRMPALLERYRGAM